MSIPSKFSVVELARLSFPSHTKRWRFKRLKFILRGYLYRTELRQLWTLFQQPLLWPLLQQNVTLLEKVMRPYLYAQSSPQQRTQLLIQHYTFLSDKLFPYIQQIYSPTGILLGQYPVADEQGGEYRVILRHDGTFRREGELTISIINPVGLRIYSCAFSVVRCGHEYGLTIGAIQGPAPEVEQPMEVIRHLTKMGFGIRPKNLVMDLTLLLADIWGLPTVRAVAKDNHVFQAKRYSQHQKANLMADYDQLWQEYGGSHAEQGFFCLSAPERKSLEQIASKKRSMYRQRFLWLDSMAEHIRQCLSTH